MKRFACVSIVAAALSFEASAHTETTALPAWIDEDKIPALADEAIPTESSPRPKADEWKTAKEVRMAYKPQGYNACKTYLLREWVKVHCNTTLTGMRLSAGNREGVLLWVVPKGFDTMFDDRQGGELIFPAKRGDRRVFELFELSSAGDWGGFATAIHSTVEEAWLPDMKGPQVTMVFPL